MSRIPAEFKPSSADTRSYVDQLFSMRPDALDVIHMDNDAIDPIRDSVLDAEACGDLPRTTY